MARKPKRRPKRSGPSPRTAPPHRQTLSPGTVALLQQAVGHHQAGQISEAEAIYRQVLKGEPENFHALHFLGVIAGQKGLQSDAVALITKALQQNPQAADAHFNLGNVLKAQDELEDAITTYRRAIALNPQYRDAHTNLGVALAGLGHYEDAAGAHRQALAIDPRYAAAHNNLGIALFKRGDVTDAMASFRRVLELDPGHVDAHWSLALALLLSGQFKEGWQEYEWRWQTPDLAPVRRNFSQTQWDGSALDGKTILLHGEQGIGDAIQFVRYAKIVAGLGGDVIVECPPKLTGLLSGVDGIGRLVARGDNLPAFDTHVPLLSLPQILGTTLETIPHEAGYIISLPGLTDTWAAEANHLAGFKIGLCWQGNPDHDDDKKRSIPLTRFEPLLAMSGMTFVSLQKGPGEEQIASHGLEGRIVDWGSNLDDGPDGFTNLAAIIKNLDLVITVDTAVAHLAGAMGMPVWMPLAYVPDWRWLLARTDTPWYPTMRLFRQPSLGDWDSVLRDLQAALKAVSNRV